MAMGNSKELIVKDLARRVIEISYAQGLSHIGSCLTALGIIEEIYAQLKEGERCILSSGHAHLAHVVVKERYGLLDAAEVIQKYGIHCDREAGCDVSTGSLGQGLAQAVGMALANREKYVYCLISDGEMSEGSIHEALRIGKEQGLTNLKVYVNVNGWGAYKKIDPQEITRQLGPYDSPDGPEINVILTSSDINDRLKGQAAHYLPLTEEEWNTLK